MVQGAGISGSLFSLLPRFVEEQVSASIPAACTYVAPPLLAAFHATRDGDLSLQRGFHVDDVLLRAWRAEQCLEYASDLHAPDGQGKLTELMQRCASDAERLLVLDIVGGNPHGGVHALFIDDGRFRLSSPAACLAAVKAVSQAGVGHGLVYDCSAPGKNIVFTDGVVEHDRLALQDALHEALMGGTPSVQCTAVFLGVAEDTERGSARAVLRQIEGKGAEILRSACHLAQAEGWPLAARRVYLTHALSCLEYLLPFAVGVSSSALRLNSLQSRWIQAVLHGGTVCRHRPLESAEAEALG